jgi:hypothetical protein
MTSNNDNSDESVFESNDGSKQSDNEVSKSSSSEAVVEILSDLVNQNHVFQIIESQRNMSVIDLL